MSPNENPWSLDVPGETPSVATPPPPAEIPPPPKSLPIPVSWPVAWRFMKWRRGVPFGIALILLGGAVPSHGGIAVLGVIVLLFAATKFILGKWGRDIRQWGAHVRGVRAAEREEHAIASAAAQAAAEYAANTAYYADWIGSEPAAGPYAAPGDDTPRL